LPLLLPVVCSCSMLLSPVSITANSRSGRGFNFPVLRCFRFPVTSVFNFLSGKHE
jgi:hypothetical protein